MARLTGDLDIDGDELTLEAGSGNATKIKSGNPSGDITVTTPITTDTLVGRDTTDTLTNKSISGSSNTLSNIDAATVGDGSVTNTIYNQIPSLYSTTWLADGEITINGGDSAKYDVAAGTGIIYNPTTDVLTNLSWGAKSAVSPTNLATQTVTHVLIDVNGDIFETNVEPTNEQLRDNIDLGAVAHPDNATIIVATTDPAYNVGPGVQVLDLYKALGNINLSGNDYSSAASVLTLNKSSGVVEAHNIDTSNLKAPNTKATPSNAPLTWFYNFVTAGTFSVVVGVTSIDPEQYNDPALGLVAVPNNKFQIKRFFYNGRNEVTVIQYGQATYNSLAEAEGSLNSEVFNKNPDLETFPLRGWLIVKKGTTDLTNTSNAKFIRGPKIDLGSATGGGASTSTTTLQQSYNNSSTPEIIIDSTRGAFSIEDASTPIAANLLEVSDFGGSTKFLAVTTAGIFGTIATATQGTIDHDSLANFVANEHIDHTAVTFTAGDGLSGGGTLAANRTFDIDISPQSDIGTPAFTDILLIEDVTDGSIKKVLASEFLGGGLLTERKTANFTAEEGKLYLVDTTSGAITATMPAGATEDIIGFMDANNNFATNSLTVAPDTGESLAGLPVNDTIEYDVDDIAVTYAFDTVASNWVEDAPVVVTTDNNVFIADQGLVGTPSFTFAGDLNTGMWSSAADVINFSTAGVERMELDATSLDITVDTNITGDLVVDGTISGLSKIKTVSSANYTILDDDDFSVIDVTTGSSDRTITLPTVSANTGRSITVIKSDSGTGSVIVDGEGSETISGELTQKLYTQYGQVTIISNGTIWLIETPIVENGTWSPATISADLNVTGTPVYTGATFQRIGNIVTATIDKIAGLSIVTGGGTTRTRNIFSSVGLPVRNNATQVFGYVSRAFATGLPFEIMTGTLIDSSGSDTNTIVNLDPSNMTSGDTFDIRGVTFSYLLP